MKLDFAILALFIILAVCGCFVGKTVENFCGLTTKIKTVCKECGNGKICDTCSGKRGPAAGGSGTCVSYECGSNNSVSTDCRYNYAPDSTKGKPRIYKYPHYYGYGTGSGFHYGEPYYIRTVDY